MKITLQNTGKKFNHKWIFNNLDLEFQSPGHYGILGNNGSGKSTLLKVISGLLSPSSGKVIWELEGKDVGSEIFRHVSIASPHLELIEEFTLWETLSFHQKFKPFINNYSISNLVEISALKSNADKALKNYSSGMKQRVKLLLAIMSNSSLVILDEPCSNLDKTSIAWYQKLVSENTGERLLIVGSNDRETECFSCRHFFNLSE